MVFVCIWKENNLFKKDRLEISYMTVDSLFSFSSIYVDRVDKKYIVILTHKI